MPLSETAKTIVRYLGRAQRACYAEPIRSDLSLTEEDYRGAIDELADYGLVGPGLAGAEEPYGCLTLTDEGRQVLASDFAPESLPLTPMALARNSIVAASWAVDRLAGAEELPAGREELVAEIVRAVEGLLPLAQECLPPDAMETVQAAAEALVNEVRQAEPRLAVIRRALRVMGFPDGTPTLNSPLVTALPPLAAALDTLLQ